MSQSQFSLGTEGDELLQWGAGYAWQGLTPGRIPEPEFKAGLDSPL